MIRVDMQTISKSSRNTSGVYIVKGDDVASISRCPKEEPEEDDDSLEENGDSQGTFDLE
jgi:DNA gyrase subunit A